MIDFPSSPVVNQPFYNGTAKYVYNGTVWKAVPLDTALPFNYLVNPSFQISQQNLDVASSATMFYNADFWFSTSTQAGYLQTQRVPGNGSKYAWRSQVIVARTSYAAGDYHIAPMQYFEGNRFGAFQWGATGVAQQMVVRFWITAPAGTYAAAVRDASGNRSFVIPVVVTAGQANTLTEKVYAVPGETSGTWATDSGTWGSLLWTWGIGTTYSTATTNAWVNGNVFGVSGQTNGMATVGNAFIIQNAGIYRDPLLTGRAPPFQYAPESIVLQECLRFWQKQKAGNGVCAANPNMGRAALMNHAALRIAPSASLVGVQRAYDQGAAPNLATISGNYCSVGYCEEDLTLSSTMAGQRAAGVIDGSESLYIAINARFA